MHAETTDLALLQAWQRHRDAEAFHTIVGRHARLVYNTCRHILRNDADAADVSQECFLCLAASPPDIRYSLSGWLHRLATHRSLDHLKMANRRRDREIRYAREATAAHTVADTELLRLVDEAIDTLPDDLRLPLIEHFLRQKTHQEVADALGISRRTVSYRINGGVERLRAELKRKGAIVPALGLAGALEAGATEAPASLYNALGKHALAGASSSAIPAATGLAAVVLMKKAWIATGVALAILLAWWLTSGVGNLKPPKPASAPVPVANDEGNRADGDDTSPSATAPADSSGDDLSSKVQAATDEAPRDGVAGRISGRVYDAESGAPIPETVVVVSAVQPPASMATVLTDASGHYETDELPGGDYLIYRDETPGYPATRRWGVGRTLREPGRIDGSQIRVNGDATVDFPVARGLPVAGIVLDKRERGISGAIVSANGYGDSYGQSAKSDAEGRFYLAGFSPTANLHVRATKSGYGEAALSNVTLAAPGMEELTIHLYNAASIRGTVVDPDGQPLEGARVIAVHFQHFGAWSFDYPEGTSVKDGTFTIDDLAPGRYNMHVYPRGYESYYTPDPTPVTLAEGEQRRDLRLVLDGGEGIEIAGLVTDTNDSPVDGARVNVFGPRERSVMTDGGGNFRVQGLVEGQYQIAPYKKGYRPIGDGSFVFGPPLRASKYDYHLVLEKFDLRVAGVVRDAETGAPLSGFEAAARMTSGERVIHASVWYESARFDNADGTFLVNVYSPWRSDREDAGAACDVFVRKAGFAPQMVTIPVTGEGDILHAEIELTRGRTIEGTVTNHHGAPVNGAIIAEGPLHTLNVWNRIDLATTDEDGHFTVAGLRDGLEAVSAVHPAYPIASAMIGGADQPLRIVFGPAGEIRGRVLLDGHPAPLTAVSVETRGTESSFDQYGATDQMGQFRFAALAAGEYDVTTRQSEGSDIFAIYIRRAVLSEGDTVVIDFNLVSGATLHGRISIGGAAPRGGNVAFEVLTDDVAAEFEPRLNGDGTWRIENAAPGPGVLNIVGVDENGEEFRRAVEIELAPGEERLLEIDLAEEEEASGAVEPFPGPDP